MKAPFITKCALKPNGGKEYEFIMKKLTCIFFVIVLLMNLTGCAIKKEDTQDKVTPEQIDAFIDDREKTLTICLPSFATIDELTTKAINKYLYELETDYKVEFNYLESQWDESFEDKLFPYLDSGAKVDLFYIFTSSMHDERISDYSMNLEEYVQSEDGKSLRESMPDYRWDLASNNGNTFGLNSHFPITTAPTYIVNKDMMEKYNLTKEDLQVPLNELNDILEEIKQKENIVPILVEDLIPNNDGYFVVENIFYIDRETQEVSYYFDTEENKILFDTMEKYKNEGLLNQVSFNNINYDNWFILYLEEYAPSISQIRGYLLNEDGEVAENEEDYVLIPISENKYLDYDLSSGLGINKNSDYKEESLDFLTKVFTDKTLNDYLTHGVENAHYTIDEYNRVVPIFDEKKAIFQNLTYQNIYLFENIYLSTPMYYEMNNKAEILEDFGRDVQVSQFVELQIYNRLNKDVMENVKEQSALVYKQLLEYFYGEEIYTLDFINEQIEIIGFNLGAALSISVEHSVMFFFGGYTHEEIVVAIRTALDEIGCQEIIKDIENILEK